MIHILVALFAAFTFNHAAHGHYQEPIGDECSACGWPLETDSRPLVGEWDDGSDEIGDFVSSGANVIVRNDVAAEILSLTSGFELRPIKFFDHPNLYRPARKSRKRSLKRVYLPYDGPVLSHLSVTRYVDLDPKSTVDIESVCQRCGSILYDEFNGVQEIRGGTIAGQRKKGKGLFVSRSALAGDGVFAPKYTGLVLCTNDVKRFIEGKQYTNVMFLEYGDLV